MFRSNSQAPAHQPWNTTCIEKTELPRGECRFILPRGSKESNGLPHRCSCRSFYPDSIVRSRCGCGHQAWHHEAQPLATVSMEKFLQALEEMKRLREEVRQVTNLTHDLKQELRRERLAREDLVRTSTAIQARMYENMQYLKLFMDDKVDAVVDRTTELSDLIKAQGERLTMVDECSMDLENRIDRVEKQGDMSTDTTPVASPPMERVSTTPRSSSPIPSLPRLMQPTQPTPSQIPIRTDNMYPMPWCVRVVFVPCKSLRSAYDPDSNGYKRCVSRNLQQTLQFPSPDSFCFTDQIEAAFKRLFCGRPWMPMIAHRPAEEPSGGMVLRLLPPHLVRREIWDYPFLDHHCIAHDKMQGDILYLTLQHEVVTWNEIQSLPAANSADNSCWNHDEELDGAARYDRRNSEMVYSTQDPPPIYSSPTHSIADRTLDKLHMLADSAAKLNHVKHTSTQASSHTTDPSSQKICSQRTPTPPSSHSLPISRFPSKRCSHHSTEHEATEDGHFDKKQKLRSKQSMPNDESDGRSQHPIYISGRSKRKMPVREKGIKEPLHFSVKNVTKWRPNLREHHPSKGKESAHNP